MGRRISEIVTPPTISSVQRRGTLPKQARKRKRSKGVNFGVFYVVETMERETRIELATNSLEGCDSTIELLPPLTAFNILQSQRSRTSEGRRFFRQRAKTAVPSTTLAHETGVGLCLFQEVAFVQAFCASTFPQYIGEGQLDRSRGTSFSRSLLSP